MQQAGAMLTEDEILVSRFKRGDDEAFDRLMAIHTDKVFALAWGMLQNREDAIDATQEVFIKLHAALAKFPATGNLNAWLYRVCLNHCIDRKRRSKYSQELSDADWARLRGPEDTEPEFRAYQSELGEIIRGAVDRLPERQRLVFILRHYKLLSMEEIGKAIGCKTGTVKAHLSRATARVRDELKGTVVFDSSEVV